MHMPGVPDDNAKRFTVTVYYSDGVRETFNGCSEIDACERQLDFTDSHGLRHEIYGLNYQIVSE